MNFNFFEIIGAVEIIEIIDLFEKKRKRSENFNNMFRYVNEKYLEQIGEFINEMKYLF